MENNTHKHHHHHHHHKHHQLRQSRYTFSYIFKKFLQIPLILVLSCAVFYVSFVALQKFSAQTDEYSVPDVTTEEKYVDFYADVNSVIVACIGDSITYGMGSGDVIAGSYIAHLSDLLPSGSILLNYGHSGVTVMETNVSPHIPFRTTQEYTESLKASPDIVVIMLGTNDACYVNENRADEFYSLLKSTVKIYKTMDSKPTVYLCTPPYRSDTEVYAGNLTEYIIPQVKKVAQDTDVTLIDIYSATENRDGLFYDGIHPTSEGYEYIADIINAYISITF